jgi:hypothetical protein
MQKLRGKAVIKFAEGVALRVRGLAQDDLDVCELLSD